MITVKLQVAYGNPKIIAMVNGLAAYHAKVEEDSYDQLLLSFDFDSEEKANKFLGDLEQYLKGRVKPVNDS